MLFAYLLFIFYQNKRNLYKNREVCFAILLILCLSAYYSIYIDSHDTV